MTANFKSMFIAEVNHTNMFLIHQFFCTLGVFPYFHSFEWSVPHLSSSLLSDYLLQTSVKKGYSNQNRAPLQTSTTSFYLPVFLSTYFIFHQNLSKPTYSRLVVLHRDQIPSDFIYSNIAPEFLPSFLNTVNIYFPEKHCYQLTKCCNSSIVMWPFSNIAYSFILCVENNWNLSKDVLTFWPLLWNRSKGFKFPENNIFVILDGPLGPHLIIMLTKVITGEFEYQLNLQGNGSLETKINHVENKQSLIPYYSDSPIKKPWILKINVLNELPQLEIQIVRHLC